MFVPMFVVMFVDSTIPKMFTKYSPPNNGLAQHSKSMLLVSELGLWALTITGNCNEVDQQNWTILHTSGSLVHVESAILQVSQVSLSSDHCVTLTVIPPIIRSYCSVLPFT